MFSHNSWYLVYYICHPLHYANKSHIVEGTIAYCERYVRRSIASNDLQGLKSEHMTWSSSCSTWLSAADDCREPCVFCSMLWSSHVAFMLLSTVSGRWSMMRLYKRNRAYKNIKSVFNDAPSTRQPIVEHTLCSPIVSLLHGHGSIVILQVFLHTLFASRGGREKIPPV